MSNKIYKICAKTLWDEAEAKGQFEGAAIDLTDGYIHFSSAAQVAETARLHFKGQDNLLLIEVDTTTLDILWEESRGGQLFPHLYNPLPLSAVSAIWPMPLNEDGQHELPEQIS